MAKYGDKGPGVAEIQKLLSFLGYDLTSDGEFGDKTLRSLKAFQKKMNLDADGVAGPKTVEALKAAQKRTSKEDKNTPPSKNYSNLEIIKTCQLDSSQYIKQRTEKDKIFIHFTAGGPSAPNVIRYWDKDEPRVATAYVIDGGDGKAYECFHPDFWSFHLGVKGTNGALDKSSVGIEICSYGPLKEVGGKFYAWPADWKTEVSKDKVYELKEEFRGFKYFQAYTQDQLDTVEKLLEFLIEEYSIPVQKSFDMNWFEFNDDLLSKKMPGIWTHTNVRKDKSDSYPDQRLLDMLNRIAKKYNT
jgi:N-acetyl-anhydromuramyl-L-alanine amidase AmpD